MMNKSLQRMGVLWCVLLAMSCFCASAKAANFSITASTWIGETEVTVKSRFVNEKHTLYLPGNWDITQVYLEIAGQSSIRVGDTVLTSGQENDLSTCLGLKQRYYNARGRQMSGTLYILHGSEMPSIHFTVDSKQLSQVNKSKNNVIEEGNFLYVEADGSIAYDGPLASLKGRGNSTFAYSKKPYQVKLPEKVNLSGMGKGKTWLLIANWLDLSLMRNQVMLDLAREVGIPNALSCQMADVYFNGTYNGLYLVTEKIQVGKKRVDIYDLEEATIQANDTPVVGTKRIDETKSEGLAILRAYAIPNDPEDITGGYILEIEKSYRFRDKITNGFRTENGISVTVKEPTYASRA